METPIESPGQAVRGDHPMRPFSDTKSDLLPYMRSNEVTNGTINYDRARNCITRINISFSHLLVRNSLLIRTSIRKIRQPLARLAPPVSGHSQSGCNRVYARSPQRNHRIRSRPGESVEDQQEGVPVRKIGSFWPSTDNSAQSKPSSLRAEFWRLTLVRHLLDLDFT